jgi:hypothetical protein
MVKDARCIMYPRSGGDTWWDHAQLLAQVDWAISIFEEAHPKCVGRFLFDHSSAHALLGPNALHAFDMNKSNGGSQRKQKDTIIPMNNPCVKHHRKAQKMTTEAGEAKGLQQTLKECRFCRNNSDRPEHRSQRLDAALRSGLLPPGFARPVFHTDAP